MRVEGHKLLVDSSSPSKMLYLQVSLYLGTHYYHTSIVWFKSKREGMGKEILELGPSALYFQSSKNPKIFFFFFFSSYDDISLITTIH